MLALGAGVDIYTFSNAFGEGHVEIQQTAADLARAGFPFAPDDDIELNGRDTALGYHAGLLFTPLRNEQGQPLVNVALVYRSRATLNLTGQFLNKSRGFALGAQADLNLPQVVTTGLAVWPIRDARREWKLEVDVDYADWTSFDHLDVTLSNGAVLPNPRNWQDSYVVMAGTEYKFVKPAWLPAWDVSIRGGYVFADSPVPERTFTPDVPDSNSHSYSAGIGFLCRRGGDLSWRDSLRHWSGGPRPERPRIRRGVSGHFLPIARHFKQSGPSGPRSMGHHHPRGFLESPHEFRRIPVVLIAHFVSPVGLS